MLAPRLRYLVHLGKRGEREGGEGKGEREGRGERVEEGGQKEVVKLSTESCSSV